MNVFKKYGIREVANVVLYSITRIGTEEFYLPVLYLDTLKVSSLEKRATAVEASGGVGNGKVISWSYNKDIQVKLEDALFSETSMNMYLNGRVSAEMSDWTSAIAKLTVANKYGRNNYSTKAYPSPEITDSEWEIIYRAAQNAGFDPRTGTIATIGSNRLVRYPNHTMKYLFDETDMDNTMVAENRWLLKKNYYDRKQKTPHSRDLSEFVDISKDYESVAITMVDLDRDKEKEQADQIYGLNYGQKFESWRDLALTYRKKDEDYNLSLSEEWHQEVVQLHFSLQKTPSGIKCLWAYITSSNTEDLEEIFTGYNKEQTEIATFHIGDGFFLSHLLYYLFPNFLEDALGDLCWCDLNDKTTAAMPQEIIDNIQEEIVDFSKLGKFNNDLYEANEIDRFEPATVENREGLKIDVQEQMENIKKMYLNAHEDYIVYYDAKNMMPFIGNRTLDNKILQQKCVRVYSETNLTKEEQLIAIKQYLLGQYDEDWVMSLTLKDILINRIVDSYGNDIVNAISTVEDERESPNEFSYINDIIIDEPRNIGTYVSEPHFYLIYFKVLKHDYITLKFGTTYYKKTRTIDENINDDTFLGTDISIDVDTFSGEYMIVGETLMRDQQTGKDKHCQFIINRSTISGSNKLNFGAKSEPTTLSLDVAVLMPYNKKSMIELREFVVEPDEAHGGTRIVPQNKHYARTPLLQIKEEIVIDNNEIY